MTAHEAKCLKEGRGETERGSTGRGVMGREERREGGGEMVGAPLSDGPPRAGWSAEGGGGAGRWGVNVMEGNASVNCVEQ